METLAIGFFRILEFFEVRSSDPVISAYRRSRRSLVIFLIGQLAFLGMAFAFAPEGEIVSPTPLPLVETLREMIADGFAIAALACMVFMVYFGLRCLHIYFRPEHYVD